MSHSGLDPAAHGRIRVDAVRLWAGGLATMIVAAGVAFVGELAVRALFTVPRLHHWGDTAFVSTPTSLVIWAAASALVATGIAYLLAVSTPRAYQFFSWIASLVIAAVILQVFITGASLADEVTTSVLYLVIGVAIVSLLSSVARTAVHYEPAARYGYDRDYGRAPYYADDPYGHGAPYGHGDSAPRGYPY
jgi:hypothetical protein